MHILYLHQYFATPLGCQGARSYEFARRWVAKGHKVTMLTSTASLTNEDLVQASGRFFKRFTVDGIDVLALAVPYRQQMGVFKRCLSFLVFLLLTSVLILFTKKVDIIYATSTPLTVGIPAMMIKLLKKAPYIFEVRDQWPEVPIDLGIIQNKLIIRLLLWLEKTIYTNSSAIVALSPGMAKGVREVLLDNSKPVTVVPNCSDIEVFKPDIDGSAVRKKRGWGNKFVFLHTGAMGRVNNLDFVVDAAVRLKEHPEILFVLLGKGSQKSALQSRVSILGLKNVEILPAMPKQQLPEILAAVDIGLVIIGNFPIIQHNSANKFFDSLSTGKPVLLNYSGWQREILEDNEAGFGCDLCNLDEFVEKVLHLNSHRQQVKKMGRNARRIAEEKFDRDKLALNALDVIIAAKEQI